MAKTKTKERESDRPAAPKVRSDAYVMMLAITFFAILAGCVLLYMDNKDYGSKSPEKAVIPPLTELGGKAPGAGDGKGGDPSEAVRVSNRIDRFASAIHANIIRACLFSMPDCDAPFPAGILIVRD